MERRFQMKSLNIWINKWMMVTRNCATKCFQIEKNSNLFLTTSIFVVQVIDRGLLQHLHWWSVHISYVPIAGGNYSLGWSAYLCFKNISISKSSYDCLSQFMSLALGMKRIIFQAAIEGLRSSLDGVYHLVQIGLRF